MSVIFAADLFCGAGGTSSGLMKVAREMGLSVNLTAINHWPRAVETHAKNHGGARHLCAALGSIEPKLAVPGGKLRLLLASPECTHHSIARGGKPMNDQSRASAWHVLHWCEELRVQDVLIENVKEFEDWGPLGANGRPLKSRKGEFFKAFINALRVSYRHVEWRRLNAKDYGDATSRIRLFIRASHKPIVWPVATHAQNPRPARDIIDWSIPGESIFTRKRPLKPNTLARIEAGIRKYWGSWAEPFIVVLRNNCNAAPMSAPLGTLCADGEHFGIVTPGQPFIVPQNSNGAPRDVGQPIPAITTTSRGVGMVQPLILSAGGPKVDAFPVSQPMNTVLTRDHMAIAEPFIVPTNYGEEGRSGQPRTRSIDQPLPTITGKRSSALIEPLVVCMANSSSGNRVRSGADPLPTATARDRFGLITPDRCKLDILFRMLQPHELAGAMGFDKDYEFTGTREERVKQIGNAVAVNMAAALCRSVLMSA